MTVFAYLRVSTSEQFVDNQLIDLEKSSGFKIDRVFADEGVSGSTPAMDRPKFSEMFEQLKSGDTLVISRVDRIGRKASDVLRIVEDLLKKGVEVFILQLGRESMSAPLGKMMLGMLSIFAEMERESIIERVNSGLNRARKDGVIFGRPPRTSPSQLKAILAKLQNKETKSAIAREFNISLKTIINYEKIYLNNPEKVVEYEQMYEKHMEQIKNNKLKQTC